MKTICAGTPGSDLGALEAAAELDWQTVGYLPSKSLKERQAIKDKYQLEVSPIDSYPGADQANVGLADCLVAVLLLENGQLKPNTGGGTMKTAQYALTGEYELRPELFSQHAGCCQVLHGKKPVLLVWFDCATNSFNPYYDSLIRLFISEHCPNGHLMVSGPQEATCPGIQEKFRQLMLAVGH